MSSYCAQCGQGLSPEWRVCPNCGTAVPSAEQAPAPLATEAQPTRVETPSPAPPPGAPLKDRLEHLWNQASGATQCPGCQRAVGAPGALCPYCGSRFPSPRVGLVGLAIAAVGGLLLLIAYATTGGLLEDNRFESASPVEGMGWLALIVGGGMFIYSVGRSGPQRQSSCCGCSCVVLVIAFPTAALILGSVGGPGMAALVLPGAIPLIWILDGAVVVGWLLRGAMRELARSLMPRVFSSPWKRRVAPAGPLAHFGRTRSSSPRRRLQTRRRWTRRCCIPRS